MKAYESQQEPKEVREKSAAAQAQAWGGAPYADQAAPFPFEPVTLPPTRRAARLSPGWPTPATSTAALRIQRLSQPAPSGWPRS